MVYPLAKLPLVTDLGLFSELILRHVRLTAFAPAADGKHPIDIQITKSAHDQMVNEIDIYNMQ